jgi:hypothetical protein
VLGTCQHFAGLLAPHTVSAYLAYYSESALAAKCRQMHPQRHIPTHIASTSIVSKPYQHRNPAAVSCLMHLQGAGPASGCALLLHFTDVGDLHNHRLQAHTAAGHAFHSLLSASLCDQYISCTTDPQCIAPTQNSRYKKEANANMSVQHAVLGSGKPYTPTLVRAQHLCCL